MAKKTPAGEAGRLGARRLNRKRRLSEDAGAPGFPVFVNLRGAGVLVIGGGRVAARRVGVMLDFGARVRVVSPELSPEMERHLGRGNFVWKSGKYAPGDMAGALLAVAASDDREINRRAGLDARKMGVLISVADRRDECGFYFPAIIQGGSLVAGLVSRGGDDHRLVRRAAAKLRKELGAFDADHQNRDEKK